MTDSERPKSLAKKYAEVFLVVVAYWFISISIVFINKTLFNSEVFKFNAPVFITWTQCIISAFICFCWEKCSKSFPKYFTFPQSRPFSSKTIRKVLPVSILSVFTISFANLSLSFVEVSFYFISKSLTTVFNVVFTYLILKQMTSVKVLSCCLVIVLGFLLGIDQENFIGTLSIKGTLFGVLSSVSLSLYSIYTKKVLPEINDKVVLLSYYNNLYSIVIFAPLIILNGELEQLHAFDFSNISFWILTGISGIFGFLIGFITTLQIQITSPLTHNISGTAKACAQTVIATYWYQEVKSLLWWISNVLVLFASAAYARFRQLEMNQKN